MLTKSATATAILANPTRTARLQLEVGDSSDALTSITSFFNGVDPLLSCSISENVDGARQAHITLRRQLGAWSYAPGVVAPGRTEPVVAEHRKVRLTVMLQQGGDLDTAETQKVFEGRIDNVDWPEDTIELQCTDMTCELRDTFIEWERVYGLCTGVNATRGALVWNTRTDAKVLALNELVVPSQLKRNGHFYKVTAVTSAQAATEPTWPTGSGATVVSGGVTLTEAGATSTAGVAVETIMQHIITDNPGKSGAFTLYTPTSPSWVVRPYLQSRDSVANALATLVDQIGWCLRWKWDSGTSAFRLTFFAPDRVTTTPVKTIAADAEWSTDGLSREVSKVRNVVRVVYGDAADRDATGQPNRKAVVVTDATSITRYGRRFMEISEASASNISSMSEATTMANAVLADLKEPESILAVTIPLDHFMELGDIVSVPADGLRFSASQALAVTALSHDLDNEGRATTKLTLSGKARSGFDSWLQMDTRVSDEGAHATLLWESEDAALSTRAVIGGARASLSGNSYSTKQLEQALEWHVSPTSGFTPSAATAKGTGKASAFEAVDLVPGKTYYGRAIPYAHNASRKVMGSPSDEFSFVAGRAVAGHIDRLVMPGVPNPQFAGTTEQSSTEVYDAPPDHWSLVAGTWGPTSDAYASLAGTSNLRRVSFRATGTNAQLRSSVFPVARGARMAKLVMAVSPTGTYAAGRDLHINLAYFSDDGTTALAGGTEDVVVAGNIVGAGSWAEFTADLIVPAGTNFARVTIYKEAVSSAYGFDVAAVFMHFSAPLAVEPWSAVTFQNSFSDFNTATFQATAYCIDSLGIVRLRGLAKRASALLNSAVFTLPVGYRPQKNSQFAVIANNKFARIEVTSAGVVQVVAADDASWFSFFSLDGITFDTRA